MKISGEVLRLTLLDSLGKVMRVVLTPRAICSPAVASLAGERVGRREMAEEAMPFPDRYPEPPGQFRQRPADEVLLNATTRGTSRGSLDRVSPARWHPLQTWIRLRAAR